ncbi:MAG TPA: hypothetical protein VD788_11135, partial [Candidatus Polarisedimenticolaceae bacterium]|nr:hypothetical protein [Candidatus Polarisedimenticolaceae bacterium]
GAPSAFTVQLPGAQPRAIPETLAIPVALSADATRVGALASCVDGVAPEPLVRTLSFSNPTSGRDKLGAGPNVKLRLTLSCREAEVVFCTAGQGCFGQPGGQLGGDLAMCNDPLAGWLTLHASQVLPLTIGGSHELNDLSTEAGSCSDSDYSAPGANGQGSGFEFQTVCDRSGAIAYLPAGTTPGLLRPDRGSNREISGVADMMATDRQGSGSRGSGAGVLAGQALALKLGLALGETGSAPYVPAGAGSCVENAGEFVCDESAVNAGAGCETAGAADDRLCFARSGITPAALGDFLLPTELCTQVAGDDRRLAETGCGDDSDDLCRSFVLPDCVTDLSVSELLAAGEEVLSGGASGVCGDDPSALTEALELINRAFDGCGKVIDCSQLPETTDTTRELDRRGGGSNTEESDVSSTGLRTFAEGGTGARR